MKSPLLSTWQNLRNPEPREPLKADIPCPDKPDAVAVKCSCGKRHTLSEFRQLHFCGYQSADDGETPEALELRNCTCGSTVAIDVEIRACAAKTGGADG